MWYLVRSGPRSRAANTSGRLRLWSACSKKGLGRPPLLRRCFILSKAEKAQIQRARAPSIGEVEAARVNVVLDKVRATLKSGEYKRQDQLVERLLEEGFSST